MPSLPSRFRETASVSLLLAFPFIVVLLVYPLAIFNRNLEEFGEAPEILTPFFAIAAGALGLCALLGFISAFVKPAFRNAVAAIALWLGCGFVLNDLVTPAILTKAIGFDGAESIIAPSTPLVTIDIVLLLATIALFWRRRDAEVRRIGPLVVLLFSLITIGPSIFEFLKSTRQVRHSHADSKWISIPPPSPTRVEHPNVYHIILDGFRGSMFNDARSEADLSAASFAGFVYFPKNRSNFDGTQTSTPVFLTGTLYHGGSFKNWHNSWTDTGIFPEVKTRLGTNIQAYSHGAYYQLTRWIQGRKIEKSGSIRQNQNVLLHLALARAAPSFARAQVFRNGSGMFSQWILSASYSLDARLQPMRTLIRDEKERPCTGQYVFTHIYFPHAPFLLDRLGRPSRHANFLSQSACALRLVAEFIAELKKTGHYNDSIIVIHSDHGWGDQIPAKNNQPVPEKIQIEAWRRSELELDNWTSALLLVKPAGAASAPLIISPRPTQLLDLPNTIYDLLGMAQRAPEGKSVVATDYPKDPERHIFTGFRRWSLSEKRQLWFGQDFFTGELNHFIWTEAAGMKSSSPLPVTWDSAPIITTTPPRPRRIKPTVIELTWPPMNNQGEYEIQMARGEGEFNTIGRGAVGSGRYTVSDVAADATYRFRARWGANDQTYAWSQIVTIPPQ